MEEWTPWRGPKYSIWNLHTIRDLFETGNSWLGFIRYFIIALGAADALASQRVEIAILLAVVYIIACFIYGSIYMTRKWYLVSAHYSNCKQHWTSMKKGLDLDNKRLVELFVKELDYRDFKIEERSDRQFIEIKDLLEKLKKKTSE